MKNIIIVLTLYGKISRSDTLSEMTFRISLLVAHLSLLFFDRMH